MRRPLPALSAAALLEQPLARDIHLRWGFRTHPEIVERHVRLTHPLRSLLLSPFLALGPVMLQLAPALRPRLRRSAVGGGGVAF